MSIYPVRAKTWWVVRKEYRHDRDYVQMTKFERDIIKADIKNGNISCLHCGKKVKDWNTAWISHGYCHGFNDAFCNYDCISKHYKNFIGKRTNRTGGHK